MVAVNPVLLVQNTYLSAAGEMTMMIPTPLTYAMSVAIRIHQAWRWKQRMKEVTETPENAAAYGAGWFLNNVVLGKGMIGQLATYPAQLVLIARNLQECIEEYSRTCRAYTAGKSILEGRIFSVKHHVNPRSLYKGGWMDPATCMWLSIHFQLLMIRVEQLFFYTLLFAACVFELSNKMISLGEATSINPNVQDEAKNSFFINTYKIIKGLADNKDDLNRQLKENKELIKTYLTQSGDEAEAQRVISYIESLEKTAVIAEQTMTPLLQNIALGVFEQVMPFATFFMPQFVVNQYQTLVSPESPPPLLSTSTSLEYTAERSIPFLSAQVLSTGAVHYQAIQVLQQSPSQPPPAGVDLPHTIEQWDYRFNSWDQAFP